MPAGKIYTPFKKDMPYAFFYHKKRQEERCVENDLLEMGEDFKNILEKKDNEIKCKSIKMNEYKKLLCSLYGLIKVMDDHHDPSIIDYMRMYLSEHVEELLGIKDDSDDEDPEEMLFDILTERL